MNYHVPVLYRECLDALRVKTGGLYFDGTLGGGGHTELILKAGGNVIAFDKDSDAISFATDRLARTTDFVGRYRIVKSDFKNAPEVLDELGIQALDGAILDLGISSHQVDAAERGFSYRNDGPLDMRMDRDEFLSAMSVVNEYSEQELAKIIFTYGEEKFSRRIAAAIVREREQSPIETTGRLANIIEGCVPRLKRGHPAKKTFQAIRIEVNSELSGLGETLEFLCSKLKPGGRLLTISFHSLEDRIVKQTYKSLSVGCVCDKSLPVCVCGHKAVAKTIGKDLRAADDELVENPRAKSAVLRILEKL